MKKVRYTNMRFLQKAINQESNWVDQAVNLREYAYSMDFQLLNNQTYLTLEENNKIREVGIPIVGTPKQVESDYTIADRSPVEVIHCPSCFNGENFSDLESEGDHYVKEFMGQKIKVKNKCNLIVDLFENDKFSSLREYFLLEG